MMENKNSHTNLCLFFSSVLMLEILMDTMGVEPKIGGFYPQNGWFYRFVMENPIKMDGL